MKKKNATPRHKFRYWLKHVQSWKVLKISSYWLGDRPGDLINRTDFLLTTIAIHIENRVDLLIFLKSTKCGYNDNHGTKAVCTKLVRNLLIGWARWFSGNFDWRQNYPHSCRHDDKFAMTSLYRITLARTRCIRLSLSGFEVKRAVHSA